MKKQAASNTQLAKITTACHTSHPEGHKLQRGSSCSNNKGAVFNRWIPAFARMTRIKTLPTTNHNLQANKGFTLIELAVVIIIIGALLVGVMHGQSLIRSSEVQNVTKTIEGYKSAAYTYKTKFNALPGDDQRAYDWFGAACDTTPSNCNGDGDGLIPDNNTTPDNEAFRFWQHLVLAKIVNGNFTGTSMGWANVLRGQVLPKLPFKDSYISVMSKNYGMMPAGSIYDNFFISGRVIQGGILTPRTEYLAPEDAKNIDTKIDDGKPWSGSVFIWPSWWTNTFSNMPNCASVTTSDYLLTYSDISCHLNFGW